MRSAAFALAASLALAGCRTSFGGYLEDRGNDTVDMFPCTVSVGPGLAVGVNATPFFGTGIGYVEEWKRVGCFPTRAYNASTRAELERFHQCSGYLGGLLIMYSHPTIEQWESANTNVFFFIPMPSERCGGDVYFDAISVLNVSADLHLGIVGIHLGVSPVNVADWLLGWLTIDFAGDDANVRFPEPRARAESRPESRKE